MARESVHEKIIRSFKEENVEFTQDEAETRDRLYYILEIKMKELYLSDYRIYKLIKDRFKVSFPQVTFDITFVERIIANRKNPGGDPQKAWVRYFISEMAKEAIRIATEKGDAHTIAYASNIMGKHQLTDKDDIEKPPYDQIIPFNPLPTTDPTVLGFKPIENLEALREKYRVKYGLEKEKLMQSISINIDDAQIIDENG